MLFGRITEMVKHLIQMEMAHISVAVDATMGNGNDTLFLSHFVGEEGQVYAFDIQESALKATEKRLEEAEADNVTLILDGHENMAKHVPEPVDLIMFNLGYLPKGRHDLITRAETTCKAIHAGLEILKGDGMLTVISYYGHEGGEAEKTAVKRLLEALNQQEYDVLEIDAINKKNSPPIIYIVRKKNIV